MSNKENFKIMRADQVDIDARTEMAKIFAEGFTQWLGFFSKDKETIAKAFAHMFVLDQYYVAIADGKVAGMSACTNGEKLAVRLNKKELRKHLGLYKGTLAGKFLKKEFEAPYVDFPPNTGSIEFVGTANEFRGQGVASQIIEYIIENTPYDNYLIEEVADTNIPAMTLYEKLGFKVYKRKPISKSASKKSGINYLLSLKYEK